MSRFTSAIHPAQSDKLIGSMRPTGCAGVAIVLVMDTPVRFKSWSVSNTLSQVILAAALFMVRPIMAASASICSRLFLFTVTYHELRMTRLVIAKRMGEVVIAASCCAYVPLVRNRPTGMNT